MTRDEIIQIAREAGDDVEHTLPSDMEFLGRFARLGGSNPMNFSENCAAAIRARDDA